jgi:hypothetical protein
MGASVKFLSAYFVFSLITCVTVALLLAGFPTSLRISLSVLRARSCSPRWSYPYTARLPLYVRGLLSRQT